MTGDRREVESLKCQYCDYDLRGMGEHGRCPECGRRFDLQELRILRQSELDQRRTLKSMGTSCVWFGLALLVMAWVPTLAMLATGFWPREVVFLPVCLTPTALMLVLVGTILLVIWMTKRP